MRKVWLICACLAASTAWCGRVIDISKANPRYFETADGAAWIPIGFNICFDREYENYPAETRDETVRKNFDRWLRTFAANGGNCIRLWAGHRSLEVMPEHAGAVERGRGNRQAALIRNN